MRVLTVKQPWAWAIVHGGKDVENRVRNIAGVYRGPVAIHGALTFDHGAAYDPRIVRALSGDDWIVNDIYVTGHILGVVDLTSVHRCWWADGQRPCSPWAERGIWHLQLANPRPLIEPIPFRGALGLRTLPADVEAQILAGVS